MVAFSRTGFHNCEPVFRGRIRRKCREPDRSVGPQTTPQLVAGAVEPNRIRRRAKIVRRLAAILHLRFILRSATCLPEVNADGKSMTLPVIGAFLLRPPFREPALRLEHSAITPDQMPVTAAGWEFRNHRKSTKARNCEYPMTCRPAAATMGNSHHHAAAVAVGGRRVSNWYSGSTCCRFQVACTSRHAPSRLRGSGRSNAIA